MSGRGRSRVVWRAADRASRWNDRSSESDWKRPSYESRTKRKSRHCTLGVGLRQGPQDLWQRSLRVQRQYQRHYVLCVAFETRITGRFQLGQWRVFLEKATETARASSVEHHRSSTVSYTKVSTTLPQNSTREFHVLSLGAGKGLRVKQLSSRARGACLSTAKPAACVTLPLVFESG